MSFSIRPSVRISMWLILLIPTISQTQGASTRVGVTYRLTIFADQGTNISSAAVQSASSKGSNLGHVFIELTSGDKQVYLGYYGDPRNPARGQLRVDADLVRNGDWDVKQTYQISEQGYRDAHQLIDTWGTNGRKWAFDHNCGDFAEAVARIAGVPLGEVPSLLGLGLSTPSLWARYLKEHGGIINQQRVPNLNGLWANGIVTRISQKGTKVNAFNTVAVGTFPAGYLAWEVVLGGDKGTGVAHWAYRNDDGSSVFYEIPVQLVVQDANTIVYTAAGISPVSGNSVSSKHIMHRKK